MKANVFILFLIIANACFAQPAGYGFGKQFMIEASQVSGTAPLTDFPVLISLTDNDLRTTANGGNVENSNGFDIIFTLGDCSTLLSHDLEYYDPTTGEIVVWVQVPTVEDAVNTPFFMFYGNSSVATDQSTASIWTDVGYDGVWHLHDDFLDASGSGNNGTNNGSTDLSPANNSADGQSFVDPNHWIELGSHPNRNGDFTYTGWARTSTNNVAGQRIICDDATNANGCHAISIGDPGTGRIRFYIRGMNPVSLDSPGGTISNNTWHYIAATFNDATNLKSLYVDGVLVNSATVSGSLGTATGNASIGGEVASGESGNRFNGDLDEIRACNAVLSADWIATEYNNQNSPATFYTVSTEYTASNLCLTLPIELLHFNAELLDSREVLLKWTTASESNNDFFTVQKSIDGINWENLATIDGAGNSTTSLSYEVIDHQPLIGNNYYRLKQTDFNGAFTYSKMKAVLIGNTGNSINIFPNPSDGFISVSGPNNMLKEIKIVDALGKDVSHLTNVIIESQGNLNIDLTQLQGGAYFLISGEQVVRVLLK